MLLFFINLVLIITLFWIIPIFIPMWRFLSRKFDAINLYKILKTNILGKEDFSSGHSFKIATGQYTLFFHNEDEALEQIEKIVNDALTYFDKLGWIAEVDNNMLNEDKKELIEILYEIRTMKWKKSEE